MTTSSYARLAAAVFAIVAILQIARAVMGWPVLIDSMDVPASASWVAAAVAAALAVLGFMASNGRNA